jgi:hypothetical protein
MLNKLKNFFNFPGSWAWACKQMESGKIIKPKDATGDVQYKLDAQNQRRIQWRFGEEDKWVNAYIFLSDFEDTWEIAQ